MKKLLKRLWIIASIILLILFIISCFSAFIPPSVFSYSTLFALAFPYLFVLTVITAIINFYVSKKLAVLMLICIPPGFYNLSRTVAFNFPRQFPLEKDSADFRVMTWNVLDFVNLSKKSSIRSRMLQLIHDYNPDILCVQELTNVEGGRWRVSVRKELDSLGFKYHIFSNDWVNSNAHDRFVTRGSAIFSKTSFKDSGRIAVPNGAEPVNLVYANTIYNKRLLRIYTVHLASYRLYLDTANDNDKDIYELTYNRKRVIQHKLREIEKIHQKEAHLIADSIAKAGFPVVFCGDMNATPTTYTYRILRNELQDAFLRRGFGIGATFYKILPFLRIDYCFVDDRLKVQHCTVVKERLSDHFPVITDIKWK